jgi:predicted SnoaL-like aldol condensation-catalyzing enzyme
MMTVEGAGLSPDHLSATHPRSSPVNKALILSAAIALAITASGAYAASPADGLTTKPAGVAAVEFLDLAINQKKVDEAVAKYVAPPYTQHNPQIADGPDGVRAGLTGFITQMPGLHVDIKRVIVDGDLVAVHSLLSGAGEHGSALVDIFRVKDGKLVEHWDVLQAVPAASANHNTMF